MKDNLPFFSHDNNARNHPKMKALIAEFGYEGYGRFWALNEKIAESAGAFIDISRKVYRLDLAKDLGLDGNGLDKFLAFLSDPDIDLINLQNNIITTDRITELFSQTMEKREESRNRKRDKKGKDDFPDGKSDFPDGIQVENEDLPAENDTDKTIQDNTKQDKIKQNNTKAESDNPQSLFLYYWQHNPDIFDFQARIEKWKDWEKFWKESHFTCSQVKTAMDNFILDVREGIIERKYIPLLPDRFVLNSWLTKCQERLKPQKPPPKDDGMKDLRDVVI